MPRIPWATRELQWLGQWAPTPKGEGNPQTQPQLGSRAATSPREHGIPSNRVSSSRGEYIPAPCTHRPSLHPSLVLDRCSPVGCLEPKLINAANQVASVPSGTVLPADLHRFS